MAYGNVVIARVSTFLNFIVPLGVETSNDILNKYQKASNLMKKPITGDILAITALPYLKDKLARILKRQNIQEIFEHILSLENNSF